MGVFNDNFDRADQVLTTDPRWGELGATGLKIVSQQLVSGVGTGSYFDYFLGQFANDFQFSQATIGHLTTLLDSLVLILRATQATSNYYVAELQKNNKVSIWRFDAGASNVLGQITSASLAVNDVIKFSVSGSTFTVFQNGSSLLSVSDSTYSTGNPGIGVLDFGDEGGAWDSWSGGDNSSVRAGVFSKDRVLYVGSFDAGIIPNYGLFDDDFVDQSNGTTVGATATGMAIVNPGVFDRRQTLMGLYGAV